MWSNEPEAILTEFWLVRTPHNVLQRRQPSDDVLVLIEDVVQCFRTASRSAGCQRFSFHLHIDLHVSLGGGKV